MEQLVSIYTEIADIVPTELPQEQDSIVFPSEHGGLSWSLWDPARKNTLCTLTGDTGTGKSFLAGKIILQALQAHRPVLILDSTGAYQPLCNVHGGRYIKTGERQRYPLPLSPTREQIPAALAFLERLSGRLSPAQRSCLETILAKGVDSLDQLRDELLAYGGEMQLWAHSFNMWCHGGRFGDVFVNKPVPCALQVLEISREFHTNFDLSNAVMAAFRASVPPGALVVIDEVELDSSFYPWLSYASKADIGVLIVRQKSLSDVRAGTQMVLHNSEPAFARYGNLRVVKGQYAEFMLIQETPHGITESRVRHQVSQQIYAQLTTNPSDRQRILVIKELRKCTELEACEQYALELEKAKN